MIFSSLISFERVRPIFSLSLGLSRQTSLFPPSLSLSFPLPIFSSFSSFFHFIPSPFFFSFLSFVSNYRGKTEGTPGNFSLPDKRKALSSALIFRVNGLLRDTIMENISLGADRRTVYNIKIIFFSEYLFSFFFIFFFLFFRVCWHCLRSG